MEQQTGLISVIVPVYNIERHIARCIESLCSQSCTKLEILLIDDGSTDNSGVICDEYAQKDARIKAIHKKNGGVSTARNLGLELAKGEFIGFVDGDDYVDPKMYEALICQFDNNGIDVAIVGFLLESKPGCFHRYCQSETETILSREIQLEYLLKNKLFSCSCCDKLFRRSVIGDTRFSEAITNYEDLLFVYQVMKKARASYFCSEPHYYYCSNSDSATTSRFNSKKMTMLDVCEYIYQDAVQSEPGMAKVARNELVRNSLMCAAMAANDHYEEPKHVARFQLLVRQNLWPFLTGYSAGGYKIQAFLLSVSWCLFVGYITRRKKKA